jgi:hypothetical protein
MVTGIFVKHDAATRQKVTHKTEQPLSSYGLSYQVLTNDAKITTMRRYARTRREAAEENLDHGALRHCHSG